MHEDGNVASSSNEEQSKAVVALPVVVVDKSASAATAPPALVPIIVDDAAVAVVAAGGTSTGTSTPEAEAVTTTTTTENSATEEHYNNITADEGTVSTSNATTIKTISNNGDAKVNGSTSTSKSNNNDVTTQHKQIEQPQVEQENNSTTMTMETSTTSNSNSHGDGDGDGDVIMEEEDVSEEKKDCVGAPAKEATTTTTTIQVTTTATTTTTTTDMDIEEDDDKEGEFAAGGVKTAIESNGVTTTTSAKLPNGDSGTVSSSNKQQSQSPSKAETTKENFNNAMSASSSTATKAETTTTTTTTTTDPNNSNDTAKEASVATPTTAAAATAALPQPPVMKGTLCIDIINEQQRRHLIRGMWNYENSTIFPPQRFELVRNLDPTEDIDNAILPVDGEFHGSFSLAYLHTTSKGKQKERSKTIPETGVHIKFIPNDENDDDTDNNDSEKANNSSRKECTEYKVEGTGTNQFGIFHIYGTATRNPKMSDTDTQPTMSIVFRKRYEPGLAVVATTSSVTTTTATATTATNSSSNTDDENAAAAMNTSHLDSAFVTATADGTGPLPDPATSFPTGVVALRGKLYKEESNDLGSTEVIHRINGTWASGLDYIEADPQNVRGLCNRFEYEHKSAVPTQQFPVSGKYSGWFDLSNEDGTRTRINERDVVLKFRTNNQGYQNVEGKGSNVFGRYTITGTLTVDNIITIFRQFQPRKLKKSNSTVNNAALGSSSHETATTTLATSMIEPNAALSSTLSSAATTLVTSNPRRSLSNPQDLKLSFDDVKIPSNTSNNDNDEPYDPIVPPVAGTYSAVSRGVLRINDDGSHSCQGKWAATREHFTNGQTSSFAFRLEPHFVTQESSLTTTGGGGGGGETLFPLDSTKYKGSFQLKKAASRYQTIIDQQIVMKFKRNKHGAYNVHGTGINAIGEFNLIGTLVTSGKTGGQVELYRMYPPEKLAVQPVASLPILMTKSDATGAVGAATPNASSSAVPTALSSASTTSKQHHQLQRRESSRMIKLPSRLEEDDPDAQLSRTMDKCLQILKFMKERDVELGAFFSEPVDPIALGIPTYVHIIKKPMDLGTIEAKMDAGTVGTPEEFAKLVRLVFGNAMTFNVDPGHSVHQAARNLLVIFNQKFRDVERMVQSIRRAHGIDVDETGKPKGKDDKKRKRQEEPKSMKQIRIDEALAMTAANATAVSAIVAAMPTTNVETVTRNEFSLLLNMMQQLQHQIVQTHLAVAELYPAETNDDTGGDSIRNTSGHETSKANSSTSTGEKKKTAKRKIEVAEEAYVPPVETLLPLTEKEQELMMETINKMPQEHIGGILEIIREAAPVDENDDEIDLGIDQLDDETQRKLFRHIQVYLKTTKTKPKKKAKSNPPNPQPKKVAEKAPPPPKKPPAAQKPKQATSSDSFFRFGQKTGSDSDDDSDDDDNNGAMYRSTANNNSAGGKQIASFKGVDDFNLGDGLDLADDNDEDNNEIPVNWGDISKSSAGASNKNTNDDDEEDDDDDWGKVAREQAAIAKARDADRRAREEKKKTEVEQASRIRLAEAAHRGEEIKAQRAEDEAKEATIREQHERDAENARQKAKNAAREQLSSVQQTVDLDAQRDIMKKYDFDNKDLGGASPSSDFGF